MKKRKELSADALRRAVEERAGGRCEYCHAPQSVSGYRYHLDHVIPSKDGGSDKLTNRALACAPCNLAKIDRTRAVDPQSGEQVAIFNPRKSSWEEHFHWDDDRETLLGRTEIGRATVSALDMNNEMRMGARRLWFATNWLP